MPPAHPPEESANEDSAKKDSQKEKPKEEAAEKEAAKKEKSKKEISSPTKLQKKYISAWEDWHMRDFLVNFPLHNYNWKYLSYDESGKLRYEGDKEYTIRNGIDVSEFQGAIDWKKVKKAGYDFVFVRAGHRTMHTGDLQRDNRAIKNIRRAKKAGLDVGVYVFSQAVTEEEAREEAELCLDVVKDSGVEITLPVVFDPEIVVEDYYARINYISGKQRCLLGNCEKGRVHSRYLRQLFYGDRHSGYVPSEGQHHLVCRLRSSARVPL